MDPKLLSLLLYVPFLIVGIVTGVIFCLKGYKQGLWRALISLGISAVSIILSVLLARLVGSLLAGPVANLLPADLLEGVGPMEDLASQFVQGLVSDVLAILFFALILLILLIVFKIVGNHVRTEDLQPENKGQRWGGVGVRALDALLVSLLLLLPLYGTIATYVSPATQVAEKVKKGDSEVVDLMSGISGNGLVSLYKVGPTAWVQGGLSGFTVGDVDVDLVEMASLLDEAMIRFERVQKAEGEEETAEAIGDLTEFLRDEMIEEDFFYQLVRQFHGEAVKEVAKMEAGEEKEFAEFFLDVADVSREEFERNGTALLDFVSYAVRPDIMENLADGNYSKLPEEFFTRFGALLNYSEQSVALKKYFLVTALAYDLFCENVEEKAYQDSSVSLSELREQAEKAAWVRASLFVANHWPSAPLTAEEQAKEAEAFVIIFFESNEANMLEAVARLPYFGAEEAISLLSEDARLKSLFYSDYNVSCIKADPSLLKPLQDRLKVCETTPLTDSSNLFHRYVELLSEKIFNPQGFDESQWEKILTNDMVKAESAPSGGNLTIMGGASTGGSAQGGMVSGGRIYLKGNEAAPVGEILASLTEDQQRQLLEHGYLDLGDEGMLIYEGVSVSYSPSEDGVFGKVEISPSEDGVIGSVEFSPSEDGVIGRTEISLAG